MKSKKAIFSAVLLAVMAVFPVVAEQVFEKIPAASVVNLKITSPKRPVRTGYVFVNGEYIPPPYRVIRYGTGIKINGKQVTGEVVPWKNFTTAFNAQPKADDREKPAKKRVRRKKEVNSLDDLFDDSPSTADSSSDSDDDSSEESDSGETDDASEEAGEYVKDARTKALLKGINNYRNKIHRQLLDGGVCFFGVEYSQIHIPSRLAPAILDLMPDSIRDARNPNELHQIFRSKGYPFINVNLCADLLNNAADTTKIAQRRRKERANEDARNVINKAVSGEL